jgi:hypothetical protein
MKKVIVTTALFLLFVSASSQPCLPEGINFESQAQIDNFQINYPGCTIIEGDVIIEGDDISNLSALNVLTSIQGDLKIGYPFGNAILFSLAGLENITEIGGRLIIEDNNLLEDLNGLSGLVSIGGMLQVTGNDMIVDFNGLNNLSSIGGSLVAVANDGLLNFHGLEGLSEIIGSFSIQSNKELTTLSGLQNINGSSIKNLYIFSNDNLSECEVASICNYLGGSPGTINLHSNAEGCNSQQEVENACGLQIDESKFHPAITIYPNPANQGINISVEGFAIDEVVIYTLTGQKVYGIKTKGESIDISILQPGMYIVEVMVEGRRIRRKLVVE